MTAELIWLAWIAFFIVVEGRALIRHRVQDTFSWQVWSLERAAPVLRWVVAGGLVWLIVHFLLHV